MRTATCTPGCVCENRLRIAGSAYVETIGDAQTATWPDDAALAAPPSTVRALVDRLQRAFGVGQERAPRLRQANAAAPSHEQARTDVPLERVQARRQRRLRHVERLRRAGHRAAPDHLHECLELMMHRPILCN